MDMHIPRAQGWKITGCLHQRCCIAQVYLTLTIEDRRCWGSVLLLLSHVRLLLDFHQSVGWVGKTERPDMTCSREFHASLVYCTTPWQSPIMMCILSMLAVECIGIHAWKQTNRAAWIDSKAKVAGLWYWLMAGQLSWCGSSWSQITQWVGWVRVVKSSRAFHELKILHYITLRKFLSHPFSWMLQTLMKAWGVSSTIATSWLYWRLVSVINPCPCTVSDKTSIENTLKTHMLMKIKPELDQFVKGCGILEATRKYFSHMYILKVGVCIKLKLPISSARFLWWMKTASVILQAHRSPL